MLCAASDAHRGDTTLLAPLDILNLKSRSIINRCLTRHQKNGGFLN